MPISKTEFIVDVESEKWRWNFRNILRTNGMLIKVH
jgi:hypothetical protein